MLSQSLLPGLTHAFAHRVTCTRLASLAIMSRRALAASPRWQCALYNLEQLPALPFQAEV